MINSPVFEAFAKNWDDATRAGLLAAGYAYQRAVKQRLMQGYTTGAFSEGGRGVAGTVAVSPPERDLSGYRLAVGTNVPYAAYWELGHMNRFTRRYERVEVWRETLEAIGAEMERAFVAAYSRVMTHGAPVPDVQFFASESPYQGPDPAPGFGGYRLGTGLRR